MGLLKLNRIHLLTYGLPLLVILSSIAIALSPILKQYPDIAIGITYDLTLISPLLFLLLSGKSNIPKIRVIPIFIIGTAVAAYILPLSGQKHLNIITTYIVPVVELIVVAVIVSKAYRSLKSFKLNRTESDDFYVLIKRSVIDILGNNKFNRFLASEIGMFYYSLFAWKPKRIMNNEFTNYKENASIALSGTMLMIVSIETAVFHILLMKWSSLAAWILTAASIYTAIMIFGHVKALMQRPSVITDRKLILKNGLIADISIDLDEINKVEFCAKEMKSEDVSIGNLGLFKEGSNHNIALYFNSTQTIEKMYGFKEECDVLLFHIDSRKEFADKVNHALEQLK